jgi:hypothetical protein
VFKLNTLQRRTHLVILRCWFDALHGDNDLTMAMRDSWAFITGQLFLKQDQPT